MLQRRIKVKKLYLHPRLLATARAALKESLRGVCLHVPVRQERRERIARKCDSNLRRQRSQRFIMQGLRVESHPAAVACTDEWRCLRMGAQVQRNGMHA